MSRIKCIIYFNVFFKISVRFPELCRSVDDDGCTFQYTYGARKGEDITIYAVSKKGKLWPVHAECNL